MYGRVDLSKVQYELDKAEDMAGQLASDISRGK